MKNIRARYSAMHAAIAVGETPTRNTAAQPR
jgi:hypothetical protein